MDFSFINDEHFRGSLVNDQRELLNCQKAGSWKAVHVLAGSIVEALLTEYLVVSGVTPGGKDPLILQLGEVIRACQEAGVIQKSTASLCDVVRDYRNLIHPGRMKRLEQEVTKEGASIAVNLVTLIAREVSEKRKATYGPTAEQIVKKVLGDHYALAVLPQLLSETKEFELSRLVSSILPELCLSQPAEFPDSDEQKLPRLREAYRRALDLLPAADKARVASRFAKMIREDSTENIEAYGESFFLAGDIVHLQQQDATITVRYLLNRIEQPVEMNSGLLRLLTGISLHVNQQDLLKFADTLVRLVMRQQEEYLDRTLKFASGEFDVLDVDKRDIFERRIDFWIQLGRERNFPKATQERLLKLANHWINIPF